MLQPRAALAAVLGHAAGALLPARGGPRVVDVFAGPRAKTPEVVRPLPVAGAREVIASLAPRVRG
eukprot:6042699-Lingulodinium_polyedra.AAC.1